MFDTTPSTPAPKTPEEALRAIRLIWAGLLMGQVMIAIVAAVLHTQGVMPKLPELGFYFAIFAIAETVVAIPAGLFVRGEVYKRHWQGHAVTPAGYNTGMLLFLAICEGSTLMGLIFILVTGTWFPTILAPILAFAAFVANFPNGKAMQPDDPFATPPSP
ncbi:MAG: hypothetical protein NTW19_07130 [Planctomycetota bacterium]|nr:hypothetical protein [Planctomycetota bacterium]